MFHMTNPGESFEEMSARLKVPVTDMIPVARLPVATCKKCRGKGSRKAGLFSKRFKPCECVL